MSWESALIWPMALISALLKLCFATKELVTSRL